MERALTRGGSAPARGAATGPRVLAAEWTKLTSVPSTPWLAVGTVAAAAGLAFALGLFVRPGDAVSGVALTASGYVLAQVGALVLGVLVGTGEFTTGTAATTFAAVPRRLPVLAAQVLVTAAATLVVAAVALGASALATAGVRDAAGLTLDLTDPATVRVAAGYLLYLTGVALLGVALGALLRHAAGALVGAVIALVVVDQLLAANPGRVADTVRALLPGSGTRLLQDDTTLTALDTASLGPHLGAWGGGAVLAAWVLVLTAAAAYRLARHDVT